MEVGTPERPVYRKMRQDALPGPRYMIICDEGWRSSIVANDMYEWTADWLLSIIGNQPYAPGRRP